MRLELQADIVIEQLFMRVDPADSSYMPSLVVISVGDNLTSMKEIKTLNVGANDTLITLLSDMTEVSDNTRCFIINQVDTETYDTLIMPVVSWLR